MSSSSRAYALGHAVIDLDRYYAEAIAQLPLNGGGVYVSGLHRLADGAQAAAPAVAEGKGDGAAAAPSSSLATLWKGKALHASRALTRGDIVFVERKLYGLVEGASARYTRVCEYCMRCLGSLEQQLAAMAVPAKRASAQTARAAFAQHPFAGDVAASPLRRATAVVVAPLPAAAGGGSAGAEQEGGEGGGEGPSASRGPPMAEQALAYTMVRAREQAVGAEDIPRERAEGGEGGQWPLPDWTLEAEPRLCARGSGEVYCSRRCNERALAAYMQVFAPAEGDAVGEGREREGFEEKGAAAQAGAEDRKSVV